MRETLTADLLRGLEARIYRVASRVAIEWCFELLLPLVSQFVSIFAVLLTGAYEERLGS